MSSDVECLKELEQYIIDEEKRAEDLLKASIQAKNSSKGDEFDRQYKQTRLNITRAMDKFNKQLEKAKGLLK
jgi:hypothetical protein